MNIKHKVLATKFIKFATVGGSGALLQIGLTVLLKNVLKNYITKVDNLVVLGRSFEIEYCLVVSVAIAIVVVFIWNFTFNLKWTFKERT